MNWIKFLRAGRTDRLDRGLPDLEVLAGSLAQVSQRHAIPQAAAERAHERMRAAVAVARASATAVPLSGRRPAIRPMVAAAAVAGLMLLAGAVAAGLLPGAGGGAGIFRSTSAEAVVLQGTLETQTDGQMTLATSAGTRVVVLDASLVVVDAVGNEIPLASLLKGQSLSVKGRREQDSRVVANEIEATSEVRGKVVSVSADLLELAGERKEFSVILTAATRIDGVLQPGKTVEVEILRDGSGQLVAKEVEVEDGDDEQEKETEDETSHPSPPAPLASPPAAPVGASREDHEDDRTAPTASAGTGQPATGQATPTPETLNRERELDDERAPIPQPTSAPPPTIAAGTPSGGDREAHPDDD